MNPDSNASANRNIAIFSYIGILVLIPFLSAAKNDPFVKFHIKQGFVLLISFVIETVVLIVPFLGWIVGTLLFFFNIVMVIIGIMNVVAGNEKELPVIGGLARNFNF